MVDTDTQASHADVIPSGQFVVAAPEQTQAQEVMTRLQDVGPGADFSVAGLDALDRVLSGKGSVHAVLVFPEPLPTLMRNLKAGVRPPQALADWTRQADQVLQCHQKFGHAASVAGLETVLASPARLLTALAQGTGQTLSERPEDAAQSAPGNESGFDLLARLTLAVSAEACACLDQLEDLSILLDAPGGWDGDDLDRMVEEIREIFARAAEGSALREERDRHFREVMRLTMALETQEQQSAARLAELDAQIETQKAEFLKQAKDMDVQNRAALKDLEELRQQIAETEQYQQEASEYIKKFQANEDALNQERAQLLARIEVQNEQIQQLARTMQDEQGARQNRDAIQQDIEADLLEAEKDRETLQAEIEMLRSSTSWKVTGPLRAVRRMLPR